MEKSFKRFTLTAAFVLLFLSVVTGFAYANEYPGSVSSDCLYYIEGTGAYVLPDPDADIFYHLGRWYRKSEDTWSVGATMDGPWRKVVEQSVPEVLVNLSPDFRTTHRLGRIPYRYVTGSGSGPMDYGSRYNYGWYGPLYRYGSYGPYYRGGRHYRAYHRREYHRLWHRPGKFMFFAVPHLTHGDWSIGIRWWGE